MASLTVLVTGGAGFVGSHTILELLNAGHNVVCVDNLCNAYRESGADLPEALRRVETITGKKIHFYEVDLRDNEALLHVFKKVSENKQFIPLERLWCSSSGCLNQMIYSYSSRRVIWFYRLIVYWSSVYAISTIIMFGNWVNIRFRSII